MKRFMAVCVVGMLSLFLGRVEAQDAQGGRTRESPDKIESLNLCIRKATGWESGCWVSLVALLAQPSNHSGKLVTVQSAAIFTGKNVVLCLDPLDYFHGIQMNCILMGREAKNIDSESRALRTAIQKGTRPLTKDDTLMITGRLSIGLDDRGEGYFASINDIQMIRLGPKVGVRPK